MSGRDISFDEEVVERAGCGGAWAHATDLPELEATRERVARDFDSRVAALYVDPKGPYPKIAGVESWDVERDATTYMGPHAVVAHPPCGPWGALHKLCRYQDKSLAPKAVEQVRRWGGVLEHPRGSRLWSEEGRDANGVELKLPRPGAAPDAWGGYTLAVEQVAWGHVCRKPTWLYLVGVDRKFAEAGVRRGGTPTHGISSKARRGALLAPSSAVRRRTPPEFAVWLISLARSVIRT